MTEVDDLLRRQTCGRRRLATLARNRSLQRVFLRGCVDDARRVQRVPFAKRAWASSSHALSHDRGTTFAGARLTRAGRCPRATRARRRPYPGQDVWTAPWLRHCVSYTRGKEQQAQARASSSDTAVHGRLEQGSRNPDHRKSPKRFQRPRCYRRKERVRVKKRRRGAL